MKKIMAFITILSVLLVPFANVKAIEIRDCATSESCFVYTPGMEVNFYRNVDESQLNSTNAGVSTIILQDGGKGQQYVRTLVVGSTFGTDTPFYDGKTENAPMTLVKKEHLSFIDQGSEFPWESARHDGTDIDIDYISLEELISVFGATKQESGNTYKIDVNKWGELFQIGVVGNVTTEDGKQVNLRANKGFYTSTIEGDNVWVVEYTLTGDNITEITVKQVPMKDSNEYAYMPVVYFDKTYDCTSRLTTDNMGCYSCEDADGNKEYRWLQKGSQAETCSLVPEVTSAGTCVTAVKTGVEDYVLEFVGIALICGIALVIAKKKDLFRSI